MKKPDKLKVTGMGSELITERAYAYNAGLEDSDMYYKPKIRRLKAKIKSLQEKMR